VSDQNLSNHSVSEHSGDDHSHGISHVASPKVLLGTFGALMVLTVLTVAAVGIDLGTNMNLLLAMVIATIKATLVCLFFMHLKYDRTLHAVAFLTALLFALLFVSFALMDSSEYQDDVIWVEEEP
jgi:cytochrome c oxidase subunit 4